MGILSLTISVGMLYVLYYIFQNYDLKRALLINCAYGIINSIINNGFNLLSIFLGIIVMLVETYIAYFIYRRSNGFWGFFGRLILIWFAMVFILSAIIASLIGSSGLLRI